MLKEDSAAATEIWDEIKAERLGGNLAGSVSRLDRTKLPADVSGRLTNHVQASHMAQIYSKSFEVGLSSLNTYVFQRWDNIDVILM